MNYVRNSARVVFLLALCLVVMFAVVKTSKASIGSISKADLSGAWQVALLHGNSGCGVQTAKVNFSLSSTGTTSAATTLTHSAGCGDTTTTGNTFTIQTLSSNGSGTANLSCGIGCGFNFQIQVSPDRGTFSLVDVSAANPNNFVLGTAIHQ
jgi:hypothetical protein